jgi:hypothetical protein
MIFTDVSKEGTLSVIREKIDKQYDVCCSHSSYFATSKRRYIFMRIHDATSWDVVLFIDVMSAI